MRYWHPFTEEAIEQVSSIWSYVSWSFQTQFVFFAFAFFLFYQTLFGLCWKQWCSSLLNMNTIVWYVNAKGTNKSHCYSSLGVFVYSLNNLLPCDSYSLLFFLFLQIKTDGITKLVVLPLYPQFSISTSGSSLRLLERIFRWDYTSCTWFSMPWPYLTDYFNLFFLFTHYIQRGRVSCEHAAYCYTIMVSAGGIYKGNGKLNPKRAGKIWFP